MNLFTALDYEGTENQTSAALLAVLAHLSPEGRDVVMGKVVPGGLGPASEVEAQRGIGGDVLDGWLRWGHRAAVAVEAKVDSPLGQDQLQRYADWLGTRTEELRVLWAITRDSAEARAEVAAVLPPEGVSIVWTSWDDLARAAEAVAGTDLDALLAQQLVGRLRRRGIASAPTEPYDPAGLARALALLPQAKGLRDALLRTFQGFAWLPGEWKVDGRFTSWTELSVYGERSLKLARPDAAGKARWIKWWFEAWAPESARKVWPPGGDRGLGVRLGVLLWGRAASDLALDDLRRALGVPDVHGSAPAPEWVPWKWDNGNYHEVWWRIPCDPFDLPGLEATLHRAMSEQAARLSPFIAGGLAAPAALHPLR